MASSSAGESVMQAYCYMLHLFNVSSATGRKITFPWLDEHRLWTFSVNTTDLSQISFRLLHRESARLILSLLDLSSPYYCFCPCWQRQVQVQGLWNWSLPFFHSWMLVQLRQFGKYVSGYSSVITHTDVSSHRCARPLLLL